MNKNLIIGLVAVAIIIVLGLALKGTGPQNQSVENAGIGGGQGDIAQDAQSGIDVTGKNLRDLMEGNLGENVRCEFSQVISDGNRVDGVTYVAGSKLRSDYKMAIPEQGQKDLHMISDGEYGYVWGDSFIGNTMQGSKFKINTEAESVEGTNGAENESLDYDVPLVKCEAWTPDVSLFDIPDDVTFTDIEALQQTSVQGITGQNCAMCDSLPADQKDACRKSLNCEE